MRTHVTGAAASHHTVAWMKQNPSMTQSALEQRARRAAKRADLIAHKSRWPLGSVDNFGNFQILDGATGAIIAGERYDMSAQEVIDFCAKH